MALVVEDGTGLEDAESFASVADADAYLAARGHSSWASLATPAKEQALRKGADYISQRYDARWGGVKTYALQRLGFPRYGLVFDNDVFSEDLVPTRLIEANILLAFKSTKRELLPDVDRTKPVVIKEKVGELERGFASDAPSFELRFRDVEDLLKPFWGSRSVLTVSLVRT